MTRMRTLGGFLLTSLALALTGCAATDTYDHGIGSPAAVQPPSPPPTPGPAPRPPSPRPPPKPAAKSPHRQYFDQHVSRYYYFDQTTHRYFWEDGSPRF